MTITFTTVLNALKSLKYHHSTPAMNPLTHLMLVDHLLADFAWEDQAYQREICLNHLLVATITDALTHMRRVHNLPLPLPEDLADEARAQIRAEAPLRNTQLTSASWMYYRYVRVDVDLSSLAYCELVGIDERTLRRYHRYGVQRLTETLLHHEGQLHEEQKRLRLLTALPMINFPRLYGREWLASLIENRLFTAQPQHLQIIGVPGIGKTALIHEVVCRLIEKASLDHLLWIDMPASAQLIYEKIRQVTSPLSLNDYLLRFHVLVVMDDVSPLSIEDLNNLLHDLNSAQVIVINRDYRALKYVLNTIAVPPIPEREAKLYIQHVNSIQYPGYEYVLTQDQIDRLWQCMGGHPTRIQEAIMAIWEDFGRDAHNMMKDVQM